MRFRKEGSMEDKKELRWMGFHAEGGRHVGQPSLLIVNYAIEYDKDYLLKWVHRGPELMIQNSWSYLRSQGVWARSKIQDPRTKIQDPRSMIQDPKSKMIQNNWSYLRSQGVWTSFAMKTNHRVRATRSRFLLKQDFILVMIFFPLMLHNITMILFEDI